MSEASSGALTAEEWENRALWRPGSDAEFDSGALWASEVLPADFPVLIALVNAEAGIVTWAMVDRIREAAARLHDSSGAGGVRRAGALPVPPRRCGRSRRHSPATRLLTRS